MTQAADAHLTPARRQYLDLKAQYPPDTLLLYRMGDFYETFDDDARRMAEALHITLTSREFGRGVRVPMAGIPHHALNGYLGRLLGQGFKVAICEQLSEPGRGIVDRGVVRVITPGTVSQPELLRPVENSYLAAVCQIKETLALAHVDVTTGEFAAIQHSGTDAVAALEAELARIGPAECLLPASMSGLPYRGTLTVLDDQCFEPERAAELLKRRLRVTSLEAFGCIDAPAIVAAAGAVVAYLERTAPELLNLLSGFQTYTASHYLALDPQTRRDLDLLRGARSGSVRGGLLAVLDQTATAMGSRLLRRFLGQPLLDVAAIEARLDAVSALVADAPRRRRLRTAIERLADAERLTGRICQGTATARDLHALTIVLRRVPTLLQELDALPALQALASELDPLPEAVDLIERAITDADGRLIRHGFHAELDALLNSVQSAQRTLLDLERQERERTGIRSLKVGYTRVFGYYIEITRPNLHLVPSEYRHKQTLANATRFTTPELRAFEEIILHAEEGAAELEEQIFAGILRELAGRSGRLLRTAAAIALLDVYLSLAEVAVRRGYVRPQLDGSLSIEINAGRHPVVENVLPAGDFIANDCALDGNGCQIALITGPNMAGKSTYLRQIALCTILAQIGSFVPASAARIGVVDRIFTRIGAQDDISAGHSTFLIEMIETATILRHATRRSLVLLDEVGRGTGTQDGLAIAQAVVEFLHHHVGARTLFATHFHELIQLSESLPRLRAFNVAAVEEAGRLIFLHRVQPGGSDRSYGVQVARLAGIPPIVAARAEELLRNADRQRPADSYISNSEPLQAPGFAAELAALDVLRMSPLEAQARLFELQQQAERLQSPIGHQPSARPEAPDSLPEPFVYQTAETEPAFLRPLERAKLVAER
ncbi:MAG: DNA mismatch repair protein MutS [Dehalococcoidia bacterium]